MARFIMIKNRVSVGQNYSFLSAVSNSFFGKTASRVQPLGDGIIPSPLGPCKAIPHESLVEHIFKDNKNWIDKPATTCAISGRSYTYGTLRALINSFAQALLSHCALKPKEVVGVLLPNIPEYVIACYGALEAGLTVTFVNPLYTPDEIKRQFESAGVKMIVTIPILLDVATAISSQLQDYKATVCIGGEDNLAKNVHSLESLLKAGHKAELPKFDPKDIAILPYSSGTTGLPKGVMLSHYNLISNLVQGEHPALENQCSRDGNRHRVLTVLPYFHIFGFNGILNICLKNRTHIVSLPKFTPEDYIKSLVKYRPTFIFVVPSLMLFLASHPAVTKEHLSSIEGVQCGAAPLTEGLLDKFQKKIGNQDICIRQGYGMTETSPVTFCMPLKTPPSKKGTIGLAYPGTDAKIINLSTGKPAGVNESGELCVKGPQLMIGYLNNTKATSETVDKDGWLHTGDVAYYDEDYYFYIVDRCKELIKVKGNQVSPTELENLLLELPGVADVAIVGIPDESAGEIPRAFIVKEGNSALTDNDVVQYLNPKVVHYKKLAGGVKFVESIPRNPGGKILRNELKLRK